MTFSVRILLLIGAIVPASAHAVDKPPALLEPYAGYDVVFGPQGKRVLGPDAAPAIEAMLTKPAPTLGAGCTVGDIALEPLRVQIGVRCGTEQVAFVLRARGGEGVEPPERTTASFVIEPPAAWATPCESPCHEIRQAAIAALLERVRQGEATVTWQRVRPQPGSPAGAFESALAEAQQALATGDPAAARRSLATALAARRLDDLAPGELLDLALLSHEAKDDAGFAAARDKLASRVEAVANQADARPDARRDATDLKLAVQVLADDPTAVVDAAAGCAKAKPPCDVVPAVRALAATGRYAQAAQVLDAGPLAKGRTPRRELLKLRFGLASAANDAAGELAVARRMIQLHPDEPSGYDVLAAGLARAGRYREAIETMHDLSRKHPERDIVLGRIAGLINFLTDAAGRDPAQAKDLEAIDARMKAAAADPKDIVARFILATRDYYAGRLAEALPQLDALAKTDNRDPRLPLYLAMTHFWLGHQDEAQRLIQRAVEIGPSDPDVFYCRSQIVRKVNLPLAIADLERYEVMTSRPWSVGPAEKAARVQAELAFMRRGELPPDWDKPGPERVVFEPAKQAGVKVSDDVRLGRIPLPGAPTPVDAAGGPTPSLAGAATPTATPTAGEPGPDAPRPADAPGTPWMPILLLAAAVAALAVRWWTSRAPKD